MDYILLNAFDIANTTWVQGLSELYTYMLPFVFIHHYNFDKYNYGHCEWDLKQTVYKKPVSDLFDRRMVNSTPI